MLDQQVGASDLARGREVCRRDALGAVVFRHKVLQLVRVGACWGLPSRVFSDGVEVVREVLRIGAAHLPSVRQAVGFALCEASVLLDDSGGQYHGGHVPGLAYHVYEL